MSQRRDHDNLEARVGELERTLAELRRELRPRRGPLGLPRPPHPRELLRFTEQYTIPTAVAMLEAQIRILEGLGAVLRAMDRGQATSERADRARQHADRTRERAESLGRETLASLDRALSDLDAAVESGDLPSSQTARDLLEDAERLTDEIEAELRETNGSTRRRRNTEAIEEEIDILRGEVDQNVGSDDTGRSDGTDDVDEPPP
ncbi:DUF7547 family protein [Halobacterium zhouii]|uniref:DUF7547 family protein n=1 Tax=Halobacterium zhouii TaxID=2902624 RepID=UPI001E5C51B6|nr:hypothetical protein [Halobacterium zhouii]